MSLEVLYVTFPSKSVAKEMAALLIEKKLIACANIYPIDSIYKWKGEIKEESEFVLWAKTTADKIHLLRTTLVQTHPYEIPCIVSFPANSTENYLKWVDEQLD